VCCDVRTIKIGALTLSFCTALQVGCNILSLIVLVYPKLCQHLKIRDIDLNNKPLKSAVSSTVTQRAILIKSKLHLGNACCVKFGPSPLGTQAKSVENKVLRRIFGRRFWSIRDNCEDCGLRT
jgi:hypothetical protein